MSAVAPRYQYGLATTFLFESRMQTVDPKKLLSFLCRYSVIFTDTCELSKVEVDKESQNVRNAFSIDCSVERG
jgi:hypothetical protein